MNASSKGTTLVPGAFAGTEQRLKELGINLSAPPEPFGTYAKAMHTGNLLFLSSMLPREGRMAKFAGRVAAKLYVEVGRRKAPKPAALNVLGRRRYWDLSTI